MGGFNCQSVSLVDTEVLTGDSKTDREKNDGSKKRRYDAWRMRWNKSEDSLPVITLPTSPVNPKLKQHTASRIHMNAIQMHMHESPKQMHTPLIPLINLLLAPCPPATELLKAVGFCYFCGWGNVGWYNKQTLRRACTVTCTYRHMGCLPDVGCDLSDSYSRYAPICFAKTNPLTH